MQTYLWNPWSLFNWPELERGAFGHLSSGSPEWPVFDIEDPEDETVLTADLPGMTDEDVEVTVAGSTLIVRGERPARDGRYVRRQRFSGSFERQFRLGDGYELDDVKAHIAHGVLTITLTKTAKARPRRIKLTTGVIDKVKGLLSGDKDKKQAA